MGEERSSVPHIQGARLCHPITSPSSTHSLHDYHARGGESMKDQAEEFMGSLETVLIGFICILLSRANCTARESGKYSLSEYPREKWHCFVEYTTLSLAHMPYFSYLWGFACTLECCPSVPAKSSPFLEAICNLFLEALPDYLLPWINHGIAQIGQFGIGVVLALSLSVMVQTAVTGHWEVQNMIYIHMFKKSLLEVSIIRNGTYWSLLGGKKKSHFFDFFCKRQVTWNWLWGNTWNLRDIV